VAIQGLMVLESGYVGSRDLFWIDDPDTDVVGYNIYRSYDTIYDWVRINTDIVPGHSYRDQTTLIDVQYTVTPDAWIEFGEFGRYGFKVPDNVIYSSIDKGIAFVATNPDDVIMTIDGAQIRPALVEGIDGTIWLPQTSVLKRDGGISETRLGNPITKTTAISVTYKKLLNSVDIYQNMTRTYYTVVPVIFGGQEKHLPGAAGTEIIDTMQIDKMDYMQKEMIRRNSWLFEQVAEPAYLMFRKTKGEACGCINVDTKQPRTGCKSCYETGIVGGYYGPIDIPYIDPDTATNRIMEEGGVKVERSSKSYLGPTPIIQNGDLIIRRNGERLVIGNPTYKSPRGVLLQQEFDTHLLPARDTRYFIPLWDPNRMVTTYNPAFSNDGNEPVSNPLTDPTKTWENPEVPVGRTITFGRIMS